MDYLDRLPDDLKDKASRRQNWFNQAITFCSTIDFCGDDIDTSDLEEVIAAIFHHYQLLDAKEKLYVRRTEQHKGNWRRS